MSYKSIDSISSLTEAASSRSFTEAGSSGDSISTSKYLADRSCTRLPLVGITLWAVVATLTAVSLATTRRTNTQGIDYDGARGGSSLATAATAGTTSIDAPRYNTWCLPNAVHQTFSGIILKDDDGVIPRGKWNGHYWWYHDEITNGFHILGNIGQDMYGFWDLSIISSTGRTEYKAAYKGDSCLYYKEVPEVGERFDEEATCRGSAWAGNVSLEAMVEYGYGMTAERWSGTIAQDQDSKSWSLPPGTESLIDLQRSPTNEGEVRLLYHRVVAPTQGVFGWAVGDSLAFDLVFTGVESMADSDVIDLVKIPAVCETMAGEFHDQQARGAG